MNQTLRQDADKILSRAIQACLPDEAIRRALSGRSFGSGRLLLVAIGKAGWQMASAAAQILGDRLTAGIVITKYGHVQGELPRCRCFEAGHPVPDENSFAATRAALALVHGARPDDTVLFLVSGGGSALFEQPRIPDSELFDLTRQMLACGASITEMNTIRKRLSMVKGGRFAQACAPAHIVSILLSDILGDPLDMIASGPAVPDPSTSAQAFAIVEKYRLALSPQALRLLAEETPKELTHVETLITGSVRELCRAGADACRELGYTPCLLTDQLDCEAREAGRFLAAIARSHRDCDRPLAFLAGGETIVRLTGKGKGGRNQELALAAAEGIAGLPGAAIFSVGSDGTDGPTDAAGGYADGDTQARLTAQGIHIAAVLQDNDAYHALAASGGLIVTGPTGTNVNDLSVLLLRPEH
jgi:glycerate 2-kinase